LLIFLMLELVCSGQNLSYPVVHTNITESYSDETVISTPDPGDPYYGQDANYLTHLPEYSDNGDSTITDHITGLVWQKYMGQKLSYAEAVTRAETLTLGGYSDWRIPSIKELYSLILFTGMVKGESAIKPFIDTAYFSQPLGDVSSGEREIDAQTWSATHYVGKTMNSDSTVFGVNFIDGRIKGYPKYKPRDGTPNKMYFRMVRGNPEYGKNNFIDHGDGTVTDLATGLMWQQDDDGLARNWEDALKYAEDFTLAGHNDWHLPNTKELHSLVDYTRCPDVTNSPAIDPVFNTTEIIDPDGNPGQYPYFWTGTSHLDGINPYSTAAYIAFGEAQGRFNDMLLDVHGAGAQRSDPKSGQAENFPDYHGPQGDVRYVYNYVRCVRKSSEVTGDRGSYSQNDNYNIYYNQIDNSIHIRSNTSTKSTIRIYNMAGKIEMVKNFNNEKHILIDINNLVSAVYLVSIYDPVGMRISRKIFKPL